MVGAALGAIQGITGIVGGMIGSGKRKREQRAAQQDYNINKAAYQNLDTSNLYSNLQNTYEDLTVNQGEAQFVKQQQQQNQANVMSGLQGAAGGSGIAALAQAMANQGSMDAQTAGVSIGQQESSNQAAKAEMAGSLQMAERRGAEDARGLQYDKTETLLGMSQNRLASANQARADATASIMKGVGSVVGAAGSFAAGGGMGDKAKDFLGKFA